MYRVNVLTTGEYGNVTTGNRYFLFKHQAKKFAKEVEQNWKCECKIEKFVMLSFGMFFWSHDIDLEEKIFRELYD